MPASLGLITSQPKRRPRRRARSCLLGGPTGGKWYHAARGLYRVWNSAEYRFYRTNTGVPPVVGDLFDNNSTLPHEPTDVYADGIWYVSVSYFNGVYDSGFLPIGPKGETYLRLDVSGGDVVDAPPWAADDVRLELRPGGVIRVAGLYLQQDGDQAATQWAIAYTIDGSTPPEDTPDISQSIDHAVLEYDLPAQSHGTTVKVRLQTRRNDGSWVYSEGSTVLTAVAEVTGPAAPPSGD